MRVKVLCVRILSEKGIVFFGPREKRAADFHKLTGNPPAAFRDQSPAVDIREQTSAAANREQSPAAADCDRSSAAEYRPTTPAESEDAMTADMMPSSLQSEELRNSGVHLDTRGPQCSTPWDPRTSVAGDRRAAKGADVCSRSEARGPGIGNPPVLEYDHCSTCCQETILDSFIPFFVVYCFTNILFLLCFYILIFTQIIIVIHVVC